MWRIDFSYFVWQCDYPFKNWYCNCGSSDSLPQTSKVIFPQLMERYLSSTYYVLRLTLNSEHSVPSFCASNYITKNQSFKLYASPEDSFIKITKIKTLLSTSFQIYINCKGHPEHFEGTTTLILILQKNYSLCCWKNHFSTGN